MRPPKGCNMTFEQSRFEHIVSVLFRVIAAGRSGSWRTSALFSALTDHYRCCFKKIYILFARTAKLDHSYIQMCEWAETHLHQDDNKELFVFRAMNEEVLMKIFDANAQRVAKEKLHRKQDHSKEPFSSFVDH